jgi:Domain of unknown function (DUF5667)
MKQFPERLNDRLEQLNARSWNGEKPADWLLSTAHTTESDHKVDELATLAHRFQSALPLQVDPDFAEHLERRMLLRNTALHLEKQSARGQLFPRLLRAHPFFGVALSLCLLLLLLGTGVLVTAAQVSNPDNPLYAVKRLEQHVQISLASSSESQARLDLQFARDRLNTLAGLSDPAHAQAYQQALRDLDQQIRAAVKAINTLPAGTYHDRLASELATLEADARQALRGLLPRLTLAERLLTTGELGRLGDNVPLLKSVEIVLPAHLKGHAIISISGDDIQPGAQLLVDRQFVEAHSTLQNGLDVFVANWAAIQHPHSIGILNPDGTAAETTAIILQIPNDHGNGNSGGNGNGNGGGKPSVTPTPHH